MSAQPLKVPPSSSTKSSSANATPVAETPKASASRSSAAPTVNVNDISSPHELTAFVETLIDQLDAKFEEMSQQMLDRMSQMSTRVDSLEASIQDIINNDISAPSAPQSPSPSVPNGFMGISYAPGVRRSGTT